MVVQGSTPDNYVVCGALEGKQLAVHKKVCCDAVCDEAAVW